MCKSRGYAVVAAIAASLSLGAAATHAADSDNAGEAATLEEVVVTAEKREATAQKTALSITALSADTLAAQGVSNVNSLNTIVPNVQVGDAGRGTVQIAIRGIGSTNDTEVGDPAMAFNVDGVYMARSRSSSGLFYDLERIEVLRGPQGTLYGRNATAGSINVISKKPSHNFEGSAQLEIGNYSMLRSSGSLNVPVSDRLAVRGAFQTQRHDGYTNNYPARSNYNDQDDVAGRLHVLFDASDRFSLLLTGDYFHAGGIGTIPAPLGSSEIDGQPYTFRVTADGFNDQKNYGFGATADWKLSIGTLTYVGSYRKDQKKWSSGAQRQFGGNSRGISSDTVVSCDDTNPSNPAAPCAIQTFFSDENSSSHELRLSHNSDALKWVAGLFYFKEGNDVLFNISPIAGIGSLTFIQPDVKAKSQAAFAQATFSATDRLRLTAGLRYTKDDKSRLGGTYFGVVMVGNVPTCPLPGGLNGQFAGPFGGCRSNQNIADFSWKSTDWKAGLEYDLSPTSLMYFNAATGYKAGGYGDGVPPNNFDYSPEKLLSFELGSKNRFRDNTLQANLSAFYYRYTDFQVSAVIPVGAGTGLVTINAPEAKIYGLEFESNALVTPNNRIDFNLSYLHARYTNFPLTLGDALTAVGSSLTGNRLAKAPDWSSSLGYQHDWPLDGGARLTSRLQTHYESDKFLEYHNFAMTNQGSYTKSDITLTYSPADEKWSAMAYVRNLEDKAVLVFAVPRAQNPASRTSGTGQYAAPRTYGIQLSAKF